MIESELLNTKNIFSKGYTENWSREIFVFDYILKTDHWIYKIKDLNGENIIEMKKNCDWIYYKWVVI